MRWLLLTLATLPFALATRPINDTLVARHSNYETARCSKVSGTYRHNKFDFGCLCDDDLDQFASNNNLDSRFKAQIADFIHDHGRTNSYPPNAQPTCEGNNGGGYTCGSLQKKPDGTCPPPPSNCSPSQAYNGGCCPRGQRYSNGRCCGNTGCNRSGSKCTPALSCDGYTSNNVCCPANTRGWIGHETMCCPPGQDEVHGQCVCPAGQKKSPSNSNTCVRDCPTGTKPSPDNKSCECNTAGYTLYDKTCCPPGQTGSNNQCNCPAGKVKSPADSTKCTSACPESAMPSRDGKGCVCKSSGFTLYDQICCPPGQTGHNNQCVCPTGLVKSTSDPIKCVRNCPAGTRPSPDNKSCVCTQSGYAFYTTICCPSGQTERNGQCVCASGQTKDSRDPSKCVQQCPSGHHHCNTRCCPTGASEINRQCVCDNRGEKLNSDGTACVSRCADGERFNSNICCKTYLTESGGKCVCPKNGETDNGSSCSKCPSGYTYNSYNRGCDPPCPSGTTYKVGYRGQGFCCRSGSTACNTVCCPSGTDEVGSSGVCCRSGSGATVVDGKCHGASPRTGSRRRSFDQAFANLTLGYFGLSANAGHKLCPTGFAACPIEGRASDEYECLDTQNDLQSCGGCASLQSGIDCTIIPGARWMGCEQGKCAVYSCRSGWTNVNGTSCEKVRRYGE